MAIRKNAEKISIDVKNEYKLVVGGKLEKIAQKINVEAKKENLVLASNTKITSDGNK